MIHEKVNDSALAEEYIEGREFYVGVLGNREPVAFPPIEMDFSGLPEGLAARPRHQGQVGEEQRRVQGDEVGPAPSFPTSCGRSSRRSPLDAYRALRVRDYGRVDLRLTETGEIYVIEVNANCYLEAASEFAMAAKAAGHRLPTARPEDRRPGGRTAALRPSKSTLQVAPGVHVVHRQRRDQGGQGDDRRGLAVLRIDLLQGVGALGQVAQQDAGALREVAGPAVDVGRQVAGEAADQRRGRPARRVRREILGPPPGPRRSARSAPSSPGGSSSGLGLPRVGSTGRASRRSRRRPRPARRRSPADRVAQLAPSSRSQYSSLASASGQSAYSARQSSPGVIQTAKVSAQSSSGCFWAYQPGRWRT